MMQVANSMKQHEGGSKEHETSMEQVANSMKPA
jgi:hypothetical protein